MTYTSPKRLQTPFTSFELHVCLLCLWTAASWCCCCFCASQQRRTPTTAAEFEQALLHAQSMSDVIRLFYGPAASQQQQHQPFYIINNEPAFSTHNYRWSQRTHAQSSHYGYNRHRVVAASSSRGDVMMADEAAHAAADVINGRAWDGAHVNDRYLPDVGNEHGHMMQTMRHASRPPAPPGGNHAPLSRRPVTHRKTHSRRQHSASSGATAQQPTRRGEANFRFIKKTIIKPRNG